MTTTKTGLRDRLFTTILNNGGGDYIARTAATEEAMFVFGSLLDLVEETEATELGVIRAEHHGSGLMMWVSDEGGMRGLIGVAAKADSSAPMWRLLHQAPPKGMKLRSNPATPPAVPWSGIILADRMRTMPREDIKLLIRMKSAIGWAWTLRAWGVNESIAGSKH